LTGNSLINYSSLGVCDTGSGFVWAPTNQNTLIGLGAANNNIFTGTNNIALGFEALIPLADGFNNIAIGSQALGNAINTDGIPLQDTIAIGYQALMKNNSDNGSLTPTLNFAIGSYALSNNTSGFNNMAIGYQSMQNNDTNSYNTAIGFQSLQNSGASSDSNTAVGYQSLQNAGAHSGANTAVGFLSLQNAGANSTLNTAIGASALSHSGFASQNNTAVGAYALSLNLTGSSNTAIGSSALGSLVSGSNNIAVGFLSGHQYGGSESNNIVLGTKANAGDQNITRIGYFSNDSIQTQSCFVAGIYNATQDSGPLPVMVSPNGKLATVSSSARYKTAIEDMGDATADLINLRPVVFNYKSHPTAKREYGLIAEEVQKHYPDIVISKDGQAETVQYQYIPVMLLNEWQKDHHMLSVLEGKNKLLEDTVQGLVHEVKQLKERIKKLTI